MKKSYKKLFYLIIVIIGLVLFIYIAKFKTEEQVNLPQSIPQPKITETFEGAYKIKLNIKEEDFNFPTESPALNLQVSTISDSKAREIANALDFKNEPVVYDDQFDGSIYFWKNDNATLLVSIEIGKIKYSINTISGASDQRLTDERIKTSAYDFLINKLLINPDDIKFSSFTYFKKQESNYGYGLIKTTKNDSNITRVVFTPQLSQFELLSINPLNPPYFIDIFNNGEIYHAEATLLTDVSETSTKYKLISFEDFRTSVDEAILVAVAGGYVSLNDIPKTSIKSVSIDEIKLAYLLDDAQSITYSPVFLLIGSIEIVDFPDNLEAELYLPAIKNF